MKIHKRIERMILNKLEFTNGWKIDDSKYKQLTKELTTEIILEIERERNKKKVRK